MWREKEKVTWDEKEDSSPLLSPHPPIVSINYLLLLALPSLSSPPYIFPPHPSLPFSLSPLHPCLSLLPLLFIPFTSRLFYPFHPHFPLPPPPLPSHRSSIPFDPSVPSIPLSPPSLPPLPFSISTYLCAYRPLEFQSVTVHSAIQLINRFFEFLKLHFSSWNFFWHNWYTSLKGNSCRILKC